MKYQMERLELELRLEMVLVQVPHKTRGDLCLFLDVDSVHQGDIDVFPAGNFFFDDAISLTRHHVKAPVFAARLIIQVRVEEG